MSSIKFTIGYAKGNLGQGYNDFFETLKPGEWGAIVDIDFILWSDQLPYIEKIITSIPDAGMFTCLTNRVGNLDQLYRRQMSDISDVRVHRNIAKRLLKGDGLRVKKLSKPISGHFMVIKKEVWDEIKFCDGILGVDNDFSKKVLDSGRSIYCMMGIYGFHYYRLCEGSGYKDHLRR